MPNFINPHQAQPTTLNSLVNSVIKNYQLIFQLTKREVIGRYKGSIFGLTWSFVIPLLMLIIYTFIFSVVFRARWNDGAGLVDSKTQFATFVFVGMIVQGLFSEVINRAPSLILNNSNYVKKVIFPLEILAIVSIGAALFHLIVSLLVLVAALFFINGFVSLTSIFLPFVLIPYLMLVLGISWIFVSLGVFMRDIGQTVGIFTAMLMFLSPVFYPLSSLPARYRNWILLNPLTFIIEQSRDVLLAGKPPNWSGLALYAAFALLITWLGYCCFQKTRKGFADVI